jgi:hypothetical protein
VARPLIAICSALTIAAMAGCGGADVTQPEPDVQSQAEIAPAPKYGGPEGTLEPDGIGEAKQGMSVDAVTELFGDPDTRETVPGCELDSEAHELIQFIYDPKGEATGILFDEPSEELQSYYTMSPKLETADGIRVGSSYDSLSEAAGDELQPLVLGSEEPSGDEGVWYVEDSPEQRLTFDVQNGRVTRILGGYTPACE